MQHDMYHIPNLCLLASVLQSVDKAKTKRINKTDHQYQFEVRKKLPHCGFILHF